MYGLVQLCPPFSGFAGKVWCILNSPPYPKTHWNRVGHVPVKTVKHSFKYKYFKMWWNKY